MSIPHQLPLSTSKTSFIDFLEPNPFNQLTEEFGLDASPIQTDLFMKANSLSNEKDRKDVHNYARAAARELLFKLQNLRNGGATFQQIQREGISSLKALEASSNKMIKEYATFQSGSKNLESRYAQFEAKLASPSTPAPFPSFISSTTTVSPLSNALGKYRIPSEVEEKPVLTTFFERVNRLANQKLPEIPNTKNEQSSEKVKEKAENFQSSFQNYVRDKAIQSAVAAKVTASALDAVGYVIKETAAHALGCRGEGRENCQVVVGYVKAGVKKAEGVAKDVITAVGAKPAIKRLISGNAMTERLVQVGLERESSGEWFQVSAQQFIQDSSAIVVDGTLMVVTAGTFKIFKSLLPSKTILKTPTSLVEKGKRYSISNHHEVKIQDAIESVGKGSVATNRKTYYLTAESSQVNKMPTEGGKATHFKKEPPYVLLSDAEEAAIKGFYARVAKKREVAKKQRKAVERQQALKDRETAIKIAAILQEEKRKMGLIGLGSRVAEKQRHVKAAKQDRSLLQNNQNLSLPDNFPKDMAEFYTKQQHFGKIPYQVIGNDILFFFPSMRKFNGSSHSISLIEAEQSLRRACLFAKEKNYNRIFLTWDPHTHSLASVANKLTSIIGVGKLPRGEFYPFNLIEIEGLELTQPKVSSARSTMKETIIKFIKNESGNIKLPIDREFFIKAFLELDYRISNGGKGSHLKLVKANSPMVIIPLDKELATGTAKQLMRIYEQVNQIHQSTKVYAEPVKTLKSIKDCHAYDNPLPHRIDYSQDYLASKQDFIEAKEFNGILSRDLSVVQYHSSAPLHDTRTHKWFMPIGESNRHYTIEDMQNAVAKLSAYGEITEISLAKIPAGEPVRFLYGRASEKSDLLINEVRPGGGVQYRFFDFDLKWIKQTKKLQ